MNRLFNTLLLTSIVFFSLTMSSQTWINNLSQEKIENGEALTFYEIQKSFNDYWDEKQVEDGYYIENGIRKKAPGWKQFKRWEWFWENRVDPVTGEFPKASAAEVRQQMRKTSGSRNVDGKWISLGPSTTPGGYAGLGRLNCIAFIDGVADTYYAGSPSGGLWKTTDDGVTWTVLTDENDALGVSDILVYPSVSPGSETIYIATGDRDGGSLNSLGGNQFRDNNTIGVLKSTDGGMTWAATALGASPDEKKTINRLLKFPGDDDVIYASGTDGVFKTTDGGATWPTIYSITEFVDMEFNPADTDLMYGSTRAGKVYKSDDGGVTWSLKLDVTSATRVELAVSEDEPGWVYAVVVNSIRGLESIHKSEDDGDTWTKVYDGSISGHNILGSFCDGTSTGGQGTYDLCIAADPSDADIVYVGGINTWKSTDGGSSWTISNMWKPDLCGAPVVHADKHNLVFQPGTGDLFECNDGGVYKTANGGTTWSHHGNGLVISQLYRLGVSQSTSNNVIIGLQDNGTKSLLSGTWKDVIGGDGMECFIDYTDDDIQYGEYIYGTLYRTTDGWSSSTLITTGLTGLGAWVTPFSIDPVTSTTIYCARDTVWKSTDKGTSWAKISAFDASGTFRSFAVAPSDPDTMYVATKTKLWATYDGGTSWSEKTGSLPTGSSNITYISVNSDFADTLWVAMGEFNSHGVYQSTDAGATWASISSGLPSIPVMCVIQNRQNTSEIELYAATDVGIYVKVGSSDWALYSEGLPNVVATEVEIYYDDATPNRSRIRAATYGRGLWESELYSPAGLPTADFDADETTPLVDSAVVFTDISNNDPTSWTWTFTPSTVTYLNSTSSTSQNPEVSFDAAGSYDIELTATNAFGSDTETKVDYITVVAAHKWTGATSTEWSTTTNWDLGTAPDETKHVIVESGATFYPEIPASFYIGSASTFSCKSLTIKSGGLVTVGDAGAGAGTDIYVYGNLKVETGGTLKISDDLRLESGGNLYVTGGTVESFVNTSTGFGDWTFKSGSGGYMTGGTLTVFSDLTFYSGSNWSVSGGTFHMGGSAAIVKIITADPDLQLNDFVIDKDVLAYISTSSTVPLSIAGDYTQEAGSMFSVSAGETLVISGDALLKSDASGNSSLINNGSFTVAGTTSVQRYIPAYSTGSDGWHLISSPTDKMTIAGSDFDPGSSDDLYQWDEATNTWLNYKNGHFTEFENGFGYLTAFATTTTASFTGTLNNSDITHTDLTLGSGSGWHILGNPFPTAIEWGTTDWAISGISATSQVWNDVGGNYLALITDDIIPSTNGFFVQAASASNSITIPTAARVFSTQDNYKKSVTTTLEETLSLTVTNDENTFYDVNRVGFKIDATDAWDVEYDAHKLYGSSSAPQLWTVSNDDIFSINYLPYSLETVAVPLHFRAGVNSTYHIEVDGTDSFYQSDEIFLEDLFSDVLIDLRKEPLYDFTATTEDAENRFIVHFYGVTSSGDELVAEDVIIYSYNKTIYIKFEQLPLGRQTVEVLDNFGKIIYTGSDISNILNTFRLDVKPGFYIVRLTGDNFSKNQKVIIN